MLRFAGHYTKLLRFVGHVAREDSSVVDRWDYHRVCCFTQGAISIRREQVDEFLFFLR